MGLLKKLQKNVKSHHILALLGLVVIVVAIQQFNARKGLTMDTMGVRNSLAGNKVTPQQVTAGADAGAPSAANPMGQNEVYASASGVSTSTQGLPPSCTQGSTAQPADLLPKDQNNEWARLNPSGGGDFKNNGNLLKAGYYQGIDTVGSSLRNANLQVRSEPPNPQTKVSPWGNTTIEPDLMRVPLEIGCGGQ
jgi:hypothetical protein